MIWKGNLLNRYLLDHSHNIERFPLLFFVMVLHIFPYYFKWSYYNNCKHPLTHIIFLAVFPNQVMPMYDCKHEYMCLCLCCVGYSKEHTVNIIRISAVIRLSRSRLLLLFLLFTDLCIKRLYNIFCCFHSRTHLHPPQMITKTKCDSIKLNNCFIITLCE